MKVKSLISAFLFTVFIYGGVAVAQAPLEGTWQATYLEFSTPDTTFTLSGDEAASQIKVINQTHFATIKQGENMKSSMFNGGTYDLTDNTYTEHLKYFSNTAQIGQSITFNSKLDKNKWEISGPIVKDGEEPGPWKLREVYTRIE
ncbi:hypothetical protein [Mangrovibacterium lignilyticum]|uniref:hypothetical protein n=1 Tax=Mangrovibacterium lignilyticum TaxID=2668052 RepID=UPI0013D12CA1|nr:hypothetical protein [Mangrovibacterium lignilyticum]